ncbi:hypothetical protein EI427_06645 [Flammeovirga pectinis]|uniref:Uncharacterized protein n=1 Tax=Flammeovirga pectinis TaxID=2494373 RepID=A0A3S9P157_9BACT|nr:hypothetical protein [Flammeovirga pectinis]AZQ61927.1 hypothetical protein EI427_06645 [Flammeovirga pectinis]
MVKHPYKKYQFPTQQAPSNGIEEKGYTAAHAQKLYLVRKKYIGGATKRKRAFSIRRKNPYTLFADRRRIKWQSDDKSVWRYYLKRSKMFKHRIYFYKLRILLEKTYHFKNDYLLFELLIQHIRNQKKQNITLITNNAPSQDRHIKRTSFTVTETTKIHQAS